MLVRMSQHVSKAQDKGSFLSKTYGQGLIVIKRNFDTFVVSFVVKFCYDMQSWHTTVETLYSTIYYSKYFI